MGFFESVTNYFKVKVNMSWTASIFVIEVSSLYAFFSVAVMYVLMTLARFHSDRTEHVKGPALLECQEQEMRLISSDGEAELNFDDDGWKGHVTQRVPATPTSDVHGNLDTTTVCQCVYPSSSIFTCIIPIEPGSM